jgi:hypothetical protein
MSGRLTTQQFLIRDLQRPPALPAGAGCDEAGRAEHYRLREHYSALIARFSEAAERDSEEAEFAHRRYAKLMAMDSGHHLRTALSLLRQDRQLTGAEVAAIVVGAERGDAITGAVRMLIDDPWRLPASEVADAVVDYVRNSDSPALAELRRALQP